MVKEHYEEAKRTWLCMGCLRPKQPFHGIDAHIQEQTPSDPPLNFVNGCGLGIIRTDFLNQLGSDVVARDLCIGRLLGPDKRQIEEWVTFRGRHSLIVRGSKNVACRHCTECGRFVYFAMGKKYLYPMPRRDVSVFDSGWGGLVVTESVYRGLNVGCWRKMYADKLPVVNEPFDSLGVLM